MRKAKEKERETFQRKQKLDSRGKSKQAKAGGAKINMNTLRNNAENSSSKIKSIHAEKIEGIKEEVQELRSALPLPDIDKMKFGFDHSSLHKSKVLVNGISINFSYNDLPLGKDNLTLHIKSGERIALKGLNGSGKLPLIKIILGEMDLKFGKIYRADNSTDQEYSLMIMNASYMNKPNISGLLEHEVKIRLNRFLFTKDSWKKACLDLSGGEK